MILDEIQRLRVDWVPVERPAQYSRVSLESLGGDPGAGPVGCSSRASINLLLSSTVALAAFFSSWVPFFAVAYNDRLPRAVALIFASAGEGRAPLALNALFIARICKAVTNFDDMLSYSPSQAI